AAGRLRDARRPGPRAARPRAEAGGRRAGRTRTHRGDAVERSRGAGTARARAAGARAERLTMERRRLAQLLAAVQRGDCSIDDALARLRGMPFEDLGFARLDHHRALRNGFPEAILGEGKSPEQVIVIAERMVAAGGSVLVTRLAPEVAARLLAALPGFEYHATPRLALRRAGPAAPTGRGTVLVVS